MTTFMKRFYHPGFKLAKKLCLPKCPTGEKSIYFSYVWGNMVQELQLKEKTSQHFYDTDKINYYSNEISKFYNNDVMFIPTSHNTPITTALKSLRKIDTNKFIKKLDSSITDNDGIFINNSENRSKLYHLINHCSNNQEIDIIESAIYGIYSNFGDSIYIANDYLSVDDDKVILANYPDKASSRELERCRVAAYCLLNGNYPIVLDEHIDFEGEANIKYIPAIIQKNGKKEQLCFGYSSSRSCTKSIKNINKYIGRMGLPRLKEICLYPREGLEKYFYHFDCISNFYTEGDTQYFDSEKSFWRDYKKNGTTVVEMNGVKNEEDTRRILETIFENVIEVRKEDDLLCANMIMQEDGIVGSSKLSNIEELEKVNKGFFFPHPSTGGGGAHKCCSNVLMRNRPLTITDWRYFLKEYGMVNNVDELFIEGVDEEMDRIIKIK